MVILVGEGVRFLYFWHRSLNSSKRCRYTSDIDDDDDDDDGGGGGGGGGGGDDDDDDDDDDGGDDDRNIFIPELYNNIAEAKINPQKRNDKANIHLKLTTS